MSDATPEPRRRTAGTSPAASRLRWRRRGLKGSWWIAEIAIGVTLGLVVFDKVVMPRVVRQGEDVEVPVVVELSVNEAVARLEESGLRAVIAEGKFSPTLSGGMVLSASPDGGLRVKKGRQVFLTPSLGIESRAVPELAGATVRIAQTKLRSVGLEIGEIHYAAVGDVADGEVLATSPGPGAAVPPDGKVELLLSRLKADVPLRMPDLTGRTGVETAAWLESCGFEVRIEETSFPGNPGEIVSQEPASGAAVYPGTELVLEVAKEPDGTEEEGLGWRERFQRRFSR